MGKRFFNGFTLRDHRAPPPPSPWRGPGLQPGQVMDFDDDAPYLKAVPVFDEEEMRSVLGCAWRRLPHGSREWLDETRGPVDLPDHR